MALLETAADRRETLLRQIYEVNRETVEAGKKGNPSALLIPIEGQHDARQAAHLAEKLRLAGVEVHRAKAAFQADGKSACCGRDVRHSDGAGVRRAMQGHAGEADLSGSAPRGGARRRKRPTTSAAGRSASCWASSVVVKAPLADTIALERVTRGAGVRRSVSPASGSRFAFDYRGPDAALAINRLTRTRRADHAGDGAGRRGGARGRRRA